MTEVNFFFLSLTAKDARHQLYLFFPPSRKNQALFSSLRSCSRPDEISPLPPNCFGLAKSETSILTSFFHQARDAENDYSPFPPFAG